MGVRARLAGVGIAAWLGSAALAGAQVQVWATRYDSGPITAQDATLGGGDRYRGKHAIATDAAGETYATGVVNKYSDTDCLTVKYNAAGAAVWSAPFDGGSADVCTAVAVDGAGGVYVTGAVGTIKYDAATGAQLWLSPAVGVALAWDGSGLLVAGPGFVRRLDAAGTQQWAQALPGEARAVALDGTGNVHVAVVESNGANDDFGVRKFDTAGTPLWARLYNGSGNAADEVHDIGVDASGGVYVTGACSNGTNGDACTVKYDAAGTQQWAAVHNGGAADSGNALVVDATGVYVTGFSRTANLDDFLTIKYSLVGATLWTRLYDDGDNDAAFAIGLDGSGAVRVTGPAFHGNEFDFRTVKYDAAGTQLWTVTHSVPANRHDISFALTVDAAGNAIVAGYSVGTTGGAQGSQFRLVKYNTAGTQQWTVPNPAVTIDPEDRTSSRNAMAVDGAGNVYVVGHSFNGQDTDLRLVKYDAAGVQAWTRTFAGNGGLDEGEAVAVDGAGNVYVTGTTTTAGNAGTNFVTIKYNGAGTAQWTVTHNNGSSDLVRALTVDGAGNVYVTGQSWNGAHYNYRTVKYNAAGAQQWAADAGATGEDSPAAIVVDAAGNVYVTGSWFNGSNFDYRTVKYNAAGALQWQVVEVGPANGADVASALAVDASGNVYVTGSSVQATSGVDFFTVKYGPTGTQLWSATYDGGANADDTAAELVLDGTGNVYVGGTAAAAGGDTNFAVVKYDGSGAQQWVATSTRPGADTATDLTLDGAGNAYVTGQAATATGLDYRTVKFDASGAQQWAVAFTGPGAREDRAVSVAVDAANVYVTGVSRDQDGNDFVTIKYSTDATAPTNPTLLSTSHTPSTWSNVGAITMQWSGAADNAGGSGLAGYSHVFDTASGTLPNTSVDTPHTADPHSTVSASLGDSNSHYFHLRTCDLAGNCAVAVEAGPYFIDRTNPDAPTGLGSSSHTPSIPSGDQTIDISWSAALDPLSNGVASGIDGYSYFFDGNATAVCDFSKDVEEGTTTATSAPLSSGTWYAHVCSRDNAGNWSALATAGPYEIVDQADLSIVKTDSADPVNASSNYSYTLAVSNAGPGTASSLTVTDVLPAGLTFVSASGTGWACVEVGGTVTCTRPSLTVGVAEAITITVTAPTQGGTVTNTASVASTTPDPAAANNSEGETTEVTAADLSIVKTDSADPVNASSNYSYTLQVSNAGPSTASSLTVTDVLPAGLTYVSASGTGWACVAVGGTVTCTRPSLAVGVAEPITVTVTAPAEAGTVTNTASVSSTTPDPVSANDSEGETTDVTAQADLSIVKSDSADPVNASTDYSYTLAVTNAGPSTAQSLTVTDALPAGLALVSATGTGWTCSEVGGTVTCTRASLAVGPAEPITITVTAPAEGGTVTNTASVSSTTADPASGNDSEGETTSVTAQADLSIVKTDSADPVNASSNYSYTLQVSNAGPSTASTLTVTDVLPAGLAFVSATGTGWTCGEVGGTVTCSRASLAVGAAEPITIAVTAPAEGGTVTNTASVSSTTADPVSGNDSEGETTDVTAQADLSIVKTDSADPVNALAEYSYTLAVSNAGPSTASSVSVTDVLPADLTLVSATGTGWSCGVNGATLTCTRASLAVGPAEPITITVNAPAEGGTVTNTASVSSTTADPVSANDSEGETTDVTAQADLSIVKTDSADPVNASTDYSYTLAVSNAGPSTAQSLTVTDALPAGLTFVSVTGTGWTCSEVGGTVTCTRSTLAVGPAEPITIVVTAPAQGGTVTNTATVSATTADPAAANDSDSETTDVGAVADLSVAKTDGQTVVVPGQTITYTITVGNAGPSPATGASVTDTLPATLLAATWTCTASSGSSCTASGAGSIGDTVDLLAGGSATYSLTATVGAALGTLANTATVAAPATAVDPNSANDSAQDADTVVDPLAVEGEVGHGTRLTADLASLGVNADEDRFRIHQDPMASYEVMVDAASGDLGANGLVLERLAADGVTVLQTSRPVGLGSARTLRWTNVTSASIDDEWIRVKSAGCASDCGADDTYRIRAWETSGRLPRFNNSLSQVTVLLLQNPTTETISGQVYFWNPAGSQVADVPFSLDAHQVLVLNTATIAGGLSGSATVVHDGPYGGLVGKAVALEPATGFSFDSPLGTRPR